MLSAGLKVLNYAREVEFPKLCEEVYIMRFLFWVLPIFLFFRIEVFNFFVNFSLSQWFLLVGASCLSLFIFRKKIKYSIVLFARKLRYFNVNEYIRKLSKSVQDNNPETMGKFLVSKLESNVFLKLNCTTLSFIILRHYPSLLTSPKPATILLLSIIVYSLMSLAFKKEILIFTIGMYFLMAFMPYVIAFISHDRGINLFENFPVEIEYLLNIDILNLTQTANKLFLFTAPVYILTILFLIISSFLVRNFLKLLFTAFLKLLKLLIPA